MPPLALLPNQPTGSPDWYTTGGNSSSMNGYGYGSGYGTPPGMMTPEQWQQWQQKQSTFLNDQAEEQRRQADQLYHQRQQELNQNYSIAKRNAKTNEERQALDKWYQQQNVKLAQDRLAEEHRQFDATFGLNQARLGYDLYGMANGMRGANNYVQASNLMRGVAGMPETPAFLNSLQTNTRLPSFVGQGGAPDAYTLGNLTAQLNGTAIPGVTTGAGAASTAGAAGATPGGYTVNGFVNQTHALARAGGGRIGAGILEQLSPDEIGLLQSGIEAPDEQGHAYNFPDFLDQFRKSRIGQSVGGNYRAA